MDDAIALIQERLTKAEVKAARAEKAWESAKSEVSDLTTALRVMTELSGGDSAAVGQSSSTADRQVAITNLLKVGEEEGRAPADLFEAYREEVGDGINLETFRTTIWRMKDKAVHVGSDVWFVKGANGQYWKIPATYNTKLRSEQVKLDELMGTNVESAEEDESPF